MKLICMSFDGDYVKERAEFKTTDEAWEYSNDLGSKWHFYPFHFITTASGKTIKAAPELLEHFIGCRTKRVAAEFERVSKTPEAANADCEQFIFLL